MSRLEFAFASVELSVQHLYSSLASHHLPLLILTSCPVLFHLGTSASTLAADLIEIGRVALLGRDGDGVVDEGKDLRIYLRVEILELNQLYVARLDLIADEVREVFADHGEANVQDPLNKISV